jgi:hypothetical protein
LTQPVESHELAGDFLNQSFLILTVMLHNALGMPDTVLVIVDHFANTSTKRLWIRFISS